MCFSFYLYLLLLLLFSLYCWERALKKEFKDTVLHLLYPVHVANQLCNLKPHSAIGRDPGHPVQAAFQPSLRGSLTSILSPWVKMGRQTQWVRKSMLNR